MKPGRFVFRALAFVFLAGPAAPGILADTALADTARSLEALVGTERAGLLRGGSALSEAWLSSPAPRLAPDSPVLREILDGFFAEISPTMLVEHLSVYRKPVTGQPVTGPWREEERAALYNRMLEFSNLAGLEYYSASRQAMRVFYESSTVVEGPAGRRALPDPVFDTPPERHVLYTRQKDLTFGNNVYRNTCIATGGAIILVQENVTPLNIAIVTAIRREQLKSVAAVFDAGDVLLVYTAAAARAASLPGLENRISASFGNRVEAISRWFGAQADKVFAPAP